MVHAGGVDVLGSTALEPAHNATESARGESLRTGIGVGQEGLLAVPGRERGSDALVLPTQVAHRTLAGWSLFPVFRFQETLKCNER